MTKIYEIPNEIIILILCNIYEIDDLINIYKCSKKARILINNEIYRYSNEKKIRKKSFLDNSISEIVHILEIYIIEYNLIYKYDKYWFKKIWDKNIIYKEIIKLFLNCAFCKYVYDNNRHRSIYECINCEIKICDKCCVFDYGCIPYEYTEDNCIHCFKCKNNCFSNILKNKKIKYTNKNIILRTYVKFVDLNDIEIKNTDFESIIKNFLEYRKLDLKKYLVDNKSTNIILRKDNILSHFEKYEKELIFDKINNFSIINDAFLSEIENYT